MAFANHAEFRAVDVGSLVDGEVISFLSPPGSYVYSTSTGGGLADDDNTILKLDDVGTGENGRAYNLATSAVLPTIAALRLAVSNNQKSIQVQNRAVSGDGGGGIFDLDAADSTSSDDGGIVIVAGTLRRRRRYSGEVHAEWFGVKADGEIHLDGVLTASANTYDSATAVFPVAIDGKHAVVRMPSNPTTHPVTLTSGSNGGTGLGLNADFGVIGGSGVPVTGGGIVFIRNDANVGVYRAVVNVSSDTTFDLFTANPVVGILVNCFDAQCLTRKLLWWFLREHAYNLFR